ncbi:MAG: glycosyltransferase family 4 protein [Janthinobacterium lividum]
MALKVTHIVRQYAPSIGGLEDVVQNIAAQQLHRHGQAPTIVTLNRLFTKPDELLAERAVVEGVPVVRLPWSGSSRYPITPSILRHLAGADVVHVHGVDFFYDFMAWSKPLHRRKLVASTHGGFFHTAFASRLKKTYFNTVTRLSSMAYDRVVGTSNNDGDMFAGIVAKNKLSVIENGVNVAKYRDLGSAVPVRTAIYFGRWSQNKGLDETLELFRQLVSVAPQWRLIIAGREYDHTVASLGELVAAKGLAAHVQLVANPSQQELAGLIGSASYYVCLSRHEGFGLAAIEAMSAGLIPLLSDIPPFRHLIETSGYGLVLANGETAASVKRITAQHVETERNHAQLRQAVQQFVLRYSWDQVAQRYIDIYTELVPQEKRRA